jgi:hypothetical protein
VVTAFPVLEAYSVRYAQAYGHNLTPEVTPSIAEACGRKAQLTPRRNWLRPLAPLTLGYAHTTSYARLRLGVGVKPQLRQAENSCASNTVHGLFFLAECSK